AAAHALRVHSDDGDHGLAGVDELLDLDVPFGPGVSPVPKPAFNPGDPLIDALVRGVVVMNLSVLVQELPWQFARGEPLLIEAHYEGHVLLGHRPRSIPKTAKMRQRDDRGEAHDVAVS